ncbi:uncharacterized protein LOC133923846 [Phragmites australis]|uniref:uncharacterized protein LOC133923846 n=1 Tax=Phragmites australis TaxID=29695 RepID=UPI002D7807F3|nr:uncharacterized protein LOC133923846 [Phragmites australis]
MTVGTRCARRGRGGSGGRTGGTEEEEAVTASVQAVTTRGRNNALVNPSQTRSICSAGLRMAAVPLPDGAVVHFCLPRAGPAHPRKVVKLQQRRRRGLARPAAAGHRCGRERWSRAWLDARYGSRRRRAGRDLGRAAAADDEQILVASCSLGNKRQQSESISDPVDGENKSCSLLIDEEANLAQDAMQMEQSML